MMHPVVQLVYTLIDLYLFVLFAWIILSWLISLNIVNRYQPVVQRLNFALFRLTDPLLRPIRKRMPDLGGIDISPIVLILALYFIQNSIVYYSIYH